MNYVFALIRQSVAAAASNRSQFFLLSAAMGLQNAVFFILWVVFFHSVHDVKGWQLQDVGLLVGMLGLGVGCAFFLGEGSRRIAAHIVSGGLDVVLLRPRHPLPQLITMESSTWSLGDIVYGLGLIVFVGRPDFTGFLLALTSAFCIGVIFLAVVIMAQSLAFFIDGGAWLADQLFIAMICMGTTPQHTQGMVMKLILFSILPAGFAAILPVELVRQHSFGLLAVLIGAAAGYLGLAVLVFHAGLKRYTSAT